VRDPLRVYDVACRYGGDEIVIIVPGAETVAALALAEQLRAGIEQLVFAGATEARLTASLGVASFPSDGATADALLQAADEAMYQAKSEGRNRVATPPAAAS
jgi:diguanylate cyclase (GGDEF)-like protein